MATYLFQGQGGIIEKIVLKNYGDQKIFAKTTGPIQPKLTKSNLGLIKENSVC